MYKFSLVLDLLLIYVRMKRGTYIFWTNKNVMNDFIMELLDSKYVNIKNTLFWIILPVKNSRHLATNFRGDSRRYFANNSRRGFTVRGENARGIKRPGSPRPHEIWGFRLSSTVNLLYWCEIYSFVFIWLFEYLS